MRNILRLDLPGKEQRSAYQNEYENGDYFQQRKPVFKRPIVANGEKIDGQKKQTENDHPDHGGHGGIPLPHISSGGHHF